MATEPGHTGENFADLAGGEARLGLTTTTVTFEQKPEQQDYYILVTGVNGTGESAFSEEIVLIGGLAVNPPTAVEDSFSIDEDSELTGNLTNNDSAGGNTTLSINVEPIIAPALGVLTINSDGSFIYTPNPNENGVDQFTYEITNSQELSSSAIVTIEITPVNDLPVAVDDEATITSSTYSEQAPGLLANVTDVDGDTLTISLDAAHSPRFGSLQINDDGSFVYTKGENFVTYDSFSYRVFDGTGFSNSVEMFIKSPEFSGFPPISFNDEYQVNEDTLLVVTSENGLLNNDFDDDHPDTKLSELTVSLEQAGAHGTLALSDDGSFSYGPNENFNGLDSFQYRVTDPDGNSTTAVVSITVHPVNDLPIAVDDEAIITSSTYLEEAPGLLANVTDVDGDTLSISLDLERLPRFGSVQVNEDGSFVYTKGDNFVTYDSFSYRASDGTEFTAPVEMALRSPEFNGFPPISVNDEYEVNEGASLVVDAENGVLNNDFDDDHANSELIISVERTAEHGTFSFSDGGDGSFSYEPNENFNGLDSFLYRLTDPDGNSTTGFVAITVIPQNDPPVAVGEQYVVARDLTINIAGGLGLLRNDLDIDGDTLEVSSNTQPGSGSVIVEPDGAFVYTPGEGFVGVDSFTYRVTDGLLNSDEATVQLVVTEMHAETEFAIVRFGNVLGSSGSVVPLFTKQIGRAHV